MPQKHVIFMGTPSIAAKVLQALIDSNVIIDLVVTQPDKKTGRKQTLTPSAVKQLAQQHDLRVFQPAKIKKDHEEILNCPCDLIVTCAYGQIVPTSILEHPKYGCINLHGSLLPKYRGGAPIQRAIMNGETKSGMTLMKMVQKMDAGPVMAESVIDIDPADNSTTLFEKMGDHAATLLKEHLETILNGQAVFIEQNETEATFAPIIKREEEHIDLNQSDSQIINHIRGLSLDPGAYVLAKNKKLKIFEYEYIPCENTILGLFSQPNKKSLCLELHNGKLNILSCQYEGKPKMAGKDFVNGQGRSLINTIAQ
ncbi:methionyl-tRNA formyltransferase [Firmicutes bacterium M10-2]|nr:methionyl-tRNA formyltransferase [Firmicutes bacterium M10-2]